MEFPKELNKVHSVRREVNGSKLLTCCDSNKFSPLHLNSSTFTPPNVTSRPSADFNDPQTLAIAPYDELDINTTDSTPPEIHVFYIL